MAGRNFTGFEISSFSDMVFGFLDDGEGLPPADGFGSSFESQESDETTAFDENDEEKENGESLEAESKTFWETQNQILQVSIKNFIFFDFI